MTYLKNKTAEHKPRRLCLSKMEKLDTDCQDIGCGLFKSALRISYAILICIYLKSFCYNQSRLYYANKC